MAKVLIGSINHDGRMDAQGAATLYCLPSNAKHECTAMPKTSSLLTLNCNVVWAHALNERKTPENPGGFDWFAMLHSDIRPEKYWVDTLIEEAEKHDADLMSAAVPIKDYRGLSSIGVFDFRDPWRARYRLTFHQIINQLPETFGLRECSRVLGADDERFRADVHLDTMDVNTGCCVVRLDRDWAGIGGVWFENHDRLVRDHKKDGKWAAETQSEDWVFSRKVSNAGGKVMATRRVMIVHEGMSGWRSDKVWGRETDEDLLKPEESSEKQKEPESCPT